MSERRRRRFCTLTLAGATAFAGLACEDSEPSEPAPDTGVVEMDSGVITSDGGHDAGAQVDAGPSADTGVSGIVECPPGSVDGIAYGLITATVRFEPGGAQQVELDPIEPTESLTRVYVARLSAQNGLSWAAQATSNGLSQDVEVDRVVYDAATGETFVALRTRGIGDTVRFFNADATLAASFTQNGPGGQDLVGERGQSNLLIVKYSASGAVAWARRFGPNDAASTRRASVTGLSLTDTVVRIAADVGANPLTTSAPGTIVLGPGEPAQSATPHPDGHGLIFELSRSTGNYAAGSAVFVEQDDGDDIRAFVNGNAVANGAGVRAFGGYTFGGGATTINLGGGVQTFTEEGAAVIVRYSATGVPNWARLISRPDNNVSPRPWSILTAADGSVVTAVYASAAGATDESFEITTSDQPVPLTLDGHDNVLVRFTPAGDVAWTYVVASRTESQLYALVESGSSIYGVGQAGSTVTFESDSGSPITLEANGAYVAKHAFASGALEWVVQIGATASTPVFVQPPAVATAVEVPVRLTEATVTRGPDPVTVRVRSGERSNAVVRYTPDGDFIDCTEVVAAGGGLQLDPD